MELRRGVAGVAEPEPARWRVMPGLVAMKVGGALVLLMLALASMVVWHDPQRGLVAGVAAIGLAAYALRDLVAPVRLAADPDGVTVVTGYARRVRLPWSAIEAVRVDERSRYGVRSAYLEVDAGDSIFPYSVYDLGTPLDEVAATLCALRAAATQPTEPTEPTAATEPPAGQPDRAGSQRGERGSTHHRQEDQ